MIILFNGLADRSARLELAGAIGSALRSTILSLRHVLVRLLRPNTWRSHQSAELPRAFEVTPSPAGILRLPYIAFAN